MKDKKKVLLSIIGIIILVAITLGITYAVFTYSSLGTTENTVTTGTLKFLYTENTGVGRGINIEDALPVSDQIGKNYSSENLVFDFKVEGTNTGTEEIPYEVTLRKTSDSTLPDSNVKIYLTDMTEDLDSSIVGPTLYSNLTQTNIDVGNEIERTLYKSAITAKTSNFLKEFRLRMWIDENSKQSEINGKTFATIVNVYSNAAVMSEEDWEFRNSAEISNLAIINAESTEVSKVEDKEYDYNVGVAEGTNAITINTETLNKDATVTVEKLDSIAYNNTSIKRLAAGQTFNLTPGDNYFKITVTSANNTASLEYKLRVYRAETITIFGKKYPVLEETPTLTTSSYVANDPNGLYKSTDTNDGRPTYYFRGNVENNYVKFANNVWRIVRINEDGTIRLIMQNGINNNTNYQFNSNNKLIDDMYYSNSKAKTELQNWYTTNIVNKNLSANITEGNYFCEQAKVVETSTNSTYSGMDLPTAINYTANFKCVPDTNGHGLISASIGLINYDEVIHAGGHVGVNRQNMKYYLYNDKQWWSMSPAGVDVTNAAYVWYKYDYGRFYSQSIASSESLRPVINLKATATATGSGTEKDPFVIQ